MGTNYYTKEKKCETCGHKPAGVHLGKSSMGWTFTFQYNGGRYYKNAKEMMRWLKDKKIESEYGDEITPTEFWKMVIEKKDEKLSHATYIKEKYPERALDGIDFLIDGHSFTDCEFS